jgi:hypothetical protein
VSSPGPRREGLPWWLVITGLLAVVVALMALELAYDLTVDACLDAGGSWRWSALRCEGGVEQPPPGSR